MGRVFNVLLVGAIIYYAVGFAVSLLSLVGFVLFLAAASLSGGKIRERNQWVRRVGAIGWYFDAEEDWVLSERRHVAGGFDDLTPAMIWGHVLATRKGLTDEDVKWIKWHAANSRMPTSLVD